MTVEIIGKSKDHWPLVQRDDSKLPPHEIELSAKERQVDKLCSKPGFVYEPIYEPNQCEFLRSQVAQLNGC